MVLQNKILSFISCGIAKHDFEFLKPESNFHLLTRKKGNHVEKPLKCMLKTSAALMMKHLIVPFYQHTVMCLNTMSHGLLVICLVRSKKELLA